MRSTHQRRVCLLVQSQRGITPEQLQPKVLLNSLLGDALLRKRLNGQASKFDDGSIDTLLDEKSDDMAVIAAKRTSNLKRKNARNAAVFIEANLLFVC